MIGVLSENDEFEMLGSFAAVDVSADAVVDVEVGMVAWVSGKVFKVLDPEETPRSRVFGRLDGQAMGEIERRRGKREREFALAYDDSV